jgi:two-component system response regulator YesN
MEPSAEQTSGQDTLKELLVTCGISNIYLDLNDTARSYGETKTALKHKVYLGKNRLIPYAGIAGMQSRIPEIPIETTAEKFISLICSSNLQEAKSLLSATFDRLADARVYSSDFLFMLCNKLLLLINQSFLALGHNPEKVLPPMEVMLNSLKNLDTIEECRAYFDDLANLLYEAFHKPDKDSVRKIVEQAVLYIKSNFNSDIRLETVAGQIGISATYLSRLFKNELNINFKDYLTDIRMEKAKELLLDPGLKVYEISDRVGYSDQRYFSEAFKSKVGLTPLEYREKVRHRHE